MSIYIYYNILFIDYYIYYYIYIYIIIDHSLTIIYYDIYYSLIIDFDGPHWDMAKFVFHIKVGVTNTGTGKMTIWRLWRKNSCDSHDGSTKASSHLGTSSTQHTMSQLGHLISLNII